MGKFRTPSSASKKTRNNREEKVGSGHGLLKRLVYANAVDLIMNLVLTVSPALSALNVSRLSTCTESEIYVRSPRYSSSLRL